MGKLIGFTAVAISSFALLGGDLNSHIQWFGFGFAWLGGALLLTGKEDA